VFHVIIALRVSIEQHIPHDFMTTSSQKKDELKLKDKSNINNVIGNYQSYPLPLGSLDDYRIISD